MIDLGLNGKRAIVIGAGFIETRGGIGRAIVQKLTAAGVHVACVDVDETRAQRAVDDVVSNPGDAFALVGDVTNSAGANTIVDQAVDVMGGLDIVVDVVGNVKYTKTEEIEDEDWEWHLNINLTQVMYIFRAAARYMIQQGTGGSLVSVTSVDGIAGSAYHAAYGAAKAGLISYTKTLADEMGVHGIRVNTVAPGNVGSAAWDNPQVPFGSNPLNPLVPPRPQDIGDALLFFSSDLAQAVTGQCLVVDGGATVKSPWGINEELIPTLRSWRPENYVK